MSTMAFIFFLLVSIIILFVCTSAHCEGEEKGMSDSGPHMVIGKTARDEEKRAIRQIPRGEWKLGLVFTRKKNIGEATIIRESMG